MVLENIEIQILRVGPLQTNCYIVVSRYSKNSVVIDPGYSFNSIVFQIERMGLDLKSIFLTHAHFDHIGACEQLQNRYKVPIYLHPLELPILNSSYTLEMAKQLKFKIPQAIDEFPTNTDYKFSNEFYINFIHTPGHSPGSTTICLPNAIFTGDTLFCGDIGRTDLFGGDIQAMKDSLSKIKELESNWLVFPGHGDYSILKTELETNPYL